MIRRYLWFAHLATACWVIPASAGAVSLVVDRLGTSDVVQAGDTVSFSFAFQFDPDEVLLATQAEISAPHLTDFQFSSTSGIKTSNPWDLSSTFRRISDSDGNLFNPMWVHAENSLDDDAPGVTWDEVGGLAPLGSFSAVATYNGEIIFNLSNWVLSLYNGPAVPIDPTWAHYHTGVTIVGGLELPSPLPPPQTAPPPEAAPVVPPQPDGDPSPSTSPSPSFGRLLTAADRPTSISYIDGCESGCFYTFPTGDSVFYPTGDDASDLQFNVPGLHIGGVEVEGTVPEPSMALLMLMASLAIMLKRSTR